MDTPYTSIQPRDKLCHNRAPTQELFITVAIPLLPLIRFAHPSPWLNPWRRMADPGVIDPDATCTSTDVPAYVAHPPNHKACAARATPS